MQATTASADAAPAHAAVGHHDPGGTDRAAPTNHTVGDVTKQDTTRHKTIRHTVKPGESLWAIAEEHLGDGSRYKEIVELNHDLLGARPSFLEPGWVLALPAPAEALAQAHPYTVRPGDTLSGIAQEQLGDADRYLEIYDASTALTQPGGVHLTDPDVIDVGWTLNIPGAHAEPRRAARDAAAARGQARQARGTEGRAAAGRRRRPRTRRRSSRRPKHRRPLRPRSSSRRPKSPRRRLPTSTRPTRPTTPSSTPRGSSPVSPAGESSSPAHCSWR